MPKYSIVVPFHNEEENVTALYDRLKAVMEQIGDTFELVFVDDGSRDRTYRLLEEIAAVDSRVLVIKLRRNFGQTSALAAGFDHSQGDYILAMDGDLQHDPDEIPNFLAKLEEGYDVVSGWRKERVDNFVMRRFPSRFANWLMARLSRRRHPRLRHHLQGLPPRSHPEHSALWRDAPLHSRACLLVRRQHLRNPYLERQPRARQVPLRIARTFRVFFDLLTIRFLLKYMMRPLHFFGLFGALGVLLGAESPSGCLSQGLHPSARHGPHGPLSSSPESSSSPAFIDRHRTPR